MSRYMDVDQAIRIFKLLNMTALDGTKGRTIQSVEDMEYFIEHDVPTVIDIVRCKECRYSEENDANDDEVICTQTYSTMSKDGFCSDGERINDEDV